MQLQSIYDWAYNQVEFIELGDAAAWQLIAEEQITDPNDLTSLLTIGCY